MITGIPNYQTPIEIGVRCLCLRYYVVLTGKRKILGDAEARARERAANMRATFVDARVSPLLECSCGQALDFMPDDSAVMM